MKNRIPRKLKKSLKKNRANLTPEQRLLLSIAENMINLLLSASKMKQDNKYLLESVKIKPNFIKNSQVETLRLLNEDNSN